MKVLAIHLPALLEIAMRHGKMTQISEIYLDDTVTSTGSEPRIARLDSNTPDPPLMS